MHPLTRVTNKHLLPVYDRPMIYYPLEALVQAGINDILLVTGGSNSGDFLKLLRNGRDFGLEHLNYTYQEGEGGIADALSLAEYFADGDPICVILGDNIFENGIRPAVEGYPGHGARVLLAQVEDPERFGVPTIEGDRIVRIDEKPTEPRSRYAVTGVYVYDPRVFEIIRGLEPSARGELEITDVNNRYIEWDDLTYGTVEGWWTDAGTFESLQRASALIARKRSSETARGAVGAEG
jgi:glucose-1-phosphate thymidylyltransferase